ncbi:hypothetical protein [Salsuginibacillus kocurii]|uniref:hypothetical protein n=1 Tax=Salsuginibacillus kocurii TaxID=427078 RepID=UPI0003A10C9B|nr:hypothetical protein [Salsuginibacillus kocurii]
MKKRLAILGGIIIGGSVILLLAASVLGLNIFSGLVDGNEADEGVIVDVEDLSDEKLENEEVLDTIANVHRIWNDITGFAGHKEFLEEDSEAWEETESEMYQTFEIIEEAVETVNDYGHDNLQHDLENFIDVASLATKERDHEALLYSHRIIHDLDVVHNNYEATYYETTNSGYTGVKYERVEELVKEHKNNES